MLNGVKFDYTTGATAISKVLTPSSQYRLMEVRLHLNAVGTSGNFTVSLDANAGAVYDVNVITQDMTSLTDFVWSPNQKLVFELGDKLSFAWANAGGKTYGLTVVWEEV